MKVLHVIDALGVGGGAEHSLVAMLPKLRERGIDSSVATLIPRKGGLGDRLRQEGFPVEVLTRPSWPGRVTALRSHTRRVAPDLVHSTLFNANLVARAAGIGSRIPLLNSLVNTSYDPVRLSMVDIVPWKLEAMRTLDGFTARHMVEHFHALTTAVKTETTGMLGVAPQRVTVIPRGRSHSEMGAVTSQRRDETRDRLGLGRDERVILNVGRQDAQKAQADLIRAFTDVLTSHPTAVLLIAGREGDASHEVGLALKEADAGESIQLLGHRADVFDLYVAADAFVFPSRYEGLGCSLLEAMALGTPIIGSDAAAIAEVLQYGRLGEVVPRGDIGSLSDAMCRLLEEPDQGSELATRAACAFDELYDLDKVADRTAELYRRVANGALT